MESEIEPYFIDRCRDLPHLVDYVTWMCANISVRISMISTVHGVIDSPRLCVIIFTS